MRAMQPTYLDYNATTRSRVEPNVPHPPEFQPEMFTVRKRNPRGQITTLFSQLGLDVGTTDTPFAPQRV